MKHINGKKRILAFVLTVCMLLSGLGATHSFAKEKEKEPDYKKAYQKVLKSKDKVFKIGKKQYKRKAYKYYKLVDINGDGTEEMILTDTDGPFFIMDTKALVLTYSDGKVKAVKAFNSAAGMKLLVNNNRLVEYWRLSGEEHLNVYALTSKNTLKKKSYIDTYQPHHYAPDNEDTVYLNKGKACTEKEFNKLWKKYYKNELTFEKIKK